MPDMLCSMPSESSACRQPHAIVCYFTARTEAEHLSDVATAWPKLSGWQMEGYLGARITLPAGASASEAEHILLAECHHLLEASSSTTLDVQLVGYSNTYSETGVLQLRRSKLCLWAPKS